MRCISSNVITVTDVPQIRAVVKYLGRESGSLIALRHEDGDVSLDMDFPAAAYHRRPEALIWKCWLLKNGMRSETSTLIDRSEELLR